MKRHRFNFAQRVVVVIGLGFVLYLLGSWTTSLGSHPFSGWVGYAPLSNVSAALIVGGFHPWVRLVIWLIYAILWTGVSLVLLQGPTSNDGH